MADVKLNVDSAGFGSFEIDGVAIPDATRIEILAKAGEATQVVVHIGAVDVQGVDLTGASVKIGSTLLPSSLEVALQEYLNAKYVVAGAASISDRSARWNTGVVAGAAA